MAKPLPPTIKEAVDVLILDPNAALQEQFATLADLLGYEVELLAEWGVLWTVLKPRKSRLMSSDEEAFMHWIVGVISAWVRAFTAWLKSKDKEEAVARLLRYLTEPKQVKLIVEYTSRLSRPTTEWHPKHLDFAIMLSRGDSGDSEALEAGFAQDLSNLFPELEVQPTPMVIDESLMAEDSDSSTEKGDNEELVPVAMHATALMLPIRPRPAMPTQEREGVPDAATLEGPRDLTQMPPHRLVVRQEEDSFVKIYCSHEGSLIMLDNYLQKWVKHLTEYSTKLPVASIELREGLFGPGSLYDTMWIRTADHNEFNPMLVLTLVENVLGYEPVPDRGSSGLVWEFRRTKGFK